MNENKPTLKFEFTFFLFAAILLVLIGIRFGGLSPFNIGICVLLLILAPILTKILGKNTGQKQLLRISWKR